MVGPASVPPPPVPAGGHAEEPTAATLPRWVVPVLAAALVGVVVSAVVAFAQQQEAKRLRAELADTQAQVAELEERVDDLEAGGGMGGLSDLLEQFLGGQGGDLGDLFEGDLDGLLDGLPGGEDLLGSADLTSCLADVGPGGLLGGGDPIPDDDLEAQLDAITERVQRLRGLSFSAPPEPLFVPDEEFEARLRELVAVEYTPADADLDRRTLAALGAVPADIDLRALLLELVGGQAAGYYSSETGELVVRADGSGGALAPAQQVILAHELQHAVADDALGLPADDEGIPGDAGRASLALVEGDASLTMQHFTLDALDLDDQLAMATDPSLLAEQEQLGRYPQYLQHDLLFPYTEGMAFTCALYGQDGWAAVDRAYDDPPTTTAQILWPDRYAAGEQAAGTATLGAPEGWTRARSETLGAADLLWLFSAPGDDPAAALEDPRGRAAAWAGGTVEVWTDGPETAVGVALAERDGEPDLCESLTRWHEAAFPDASQVATSGAEALATDGPGQAAVITCSDGDVRAGIAPDLATARAITR